MVQKMVEYKQIRNTTRIMSASRAHGMIQDMCCDRQVTQKPTTAERQQIRKTTGQKDYRRERQQNNVGKQGTWHDI